MKRLGWRVLALLLTLLLLLGGCKGETAPQQVLTYDLAGAPRTIDPQFSTGDSAATIIANTFEGLVRISETGEPQGACAERWEVSSDGLQYTFTLRENLVWADGTPLVAADFVFGLRRLFGPPPAEAASDFLMIENAREILAGELPASQLGVVAKDDRTLVITLRERYNTLLSLLAGTAAMPCREEFFLLQKGRYGLSAEETLGNGPFVVKSWSDTLVGLSKNERYRQPTGIDQVNLYLRREDPIAQFLEGKSDGVLVAFRRLPELGEQRGQWSYDQSWVLILNAQQGVLADYEVRKAFLSALDPTVLSSLFPPQTLPTQGLLPSVTTLFGSSYRKMAGMPVVAQPTEAPRTLLREALARLEQEDVGKLSLLVSDFEPGPSLGGQMQKSWQQELPAYVNMEQLPYEELLARVQSGEFSMAITPLMAQGSAAVDFLARFAQAQGGDAMDTAMLSAAPTLSQLLDQAREQTDPQEAAKILLLAEQHLIDRFLVLPLFEAPSCFALRTGVEGIVYHPVSRTIYFADAVIR